VTLLPVAGAWGEGGAAVGEAQGLGVERQERGSNSR
jgi:hypothetical protein